LAQSVYAEGLKEVSETKSLSDKIMQHFIKEEFKTGLGIAKKYWPMPEVEIDSLANTINTQWSIVRQRFGKPFGHGVYRARKGWKVIYTVLLPAQVSKPCDLLEVYFL